MDAAALEKCHSATKSLRPASISPRVGDANMERNRVLYCVTNPSPQPCLAPSS